MEFLIILFFIWIGYVIGQIHTSYKFFKHVKGLAKEQGIQLQTETPHKHIHLLKIEKHNDTLYLFHQYSQDFVCQAKSLEDLAKFAKEYKNICFASVVYDDKIVSFIDGQFKNEWTITE